MASRSIAHHGSAFAERRVTRKRNPLTTQVDFSVENHGSIFLLRPISPAAFEWIKEHIPDDAQYFGNAVVVEHRYIEDIVDGIQNDGLEVA